MKKKHPSKKKLTAKKAVVKKGRKRNSLIIVALGFVSIIVLLFVFNPFANPVFSGKNAFAKLEQQCDFGPRFPGSEGHQQCGDFLVSELKKYSDRVNEQRFQYVDKKNPENVYQGRNIIASFNLAPSENYRVMLCAHWDTREWADQDPDSANHQLPVPGANDGASGVGVLLEIARILSEYPLDFGVDIVLFDLEDMGDYGAEANPDSANLFCIGSRHFAETQTAYRPRYGILLDMIGDKDLVIKKEGYSNYYAPQLVERVWQKAKELNLPAFSDEISDPITDDHLPFLQKGIPVIDLIDFDYPAWHTISDTPDQCSVESLQQIGDLLIALLYTKK